jgi:hypothetical protein
MLHGLQSSNHHCQKSVQKHLQKKPQMTKIRHYLQEAKAVWIMLANIRYGVDLSPKTDENELPND